MAKRWASRLSFVLVVGILMLSPSVLARQLKDLFPGTVTHALPTLRPDLVGSAGPAGRARGLSECYDQYVECAGWALEGYCDGYVVDEQCVRTIVCPLSCGSCVVDDFTSDISTSTSSDGACGPDGGGAVCPSGQCCSQYGYCGATAEHCEASCLRDFSAPDSECVTGSVPITFETDYTDPGTATGTAFGLTFDEYAAAVQNNGVRAGVATPEQYQAIVGNAEAAGGITSKRELAMFLAQVLWESTGLVDREELSRGVNADGIVEPYVPYYGRGYIQLTWEDNYRAASMALYGDERLLSEEGRNTIVTDEDTAWAVSFWYWKTFVHVSEGVQAGQFGASTANINGAKECQDPAGHEVARQRFAIYTSLLAAFNVPEDPIEAGCY